MDEKNGTELTRVDLNNFILIWTKIAELIQLITGDVRVNADGNLQEQIDAIKENGITAEKLSAARKILVNLASTESASFDGSANATPGVTGTLPIANGGTGATTAAEILTKLGITATASELNYTDGVTSNIQTQLNAKAASSHGTHVTFTTTTPKVAGTAAVGSATTVSRSDHVHPAQTTVRGNAGSATKLATARTVRTNLASTSTASFDGTANITPGVTGVLPVANGGTGLSSSNPAVISASAPSTTALWAY